VAIEVKQHASARDNLRQRLGFRMRANMVIA
jgi:hypothetical protein